MFWEAFRLLGLQRISQPVAVYHYSPGRLSDCAITSPVALHAAELLGSIQAVVSSWEQISWKFTPGRSHRPEGEWNSGSWGLGDDGS